jgi:AcrR family transcriptional regulator
MAARGSAGLSLRAIARDLGVTAPALYNYFSRLDDLITALIVDAFNALADALLAAEQGEPADGYGRQIRAGALAYRAWAISHRVDFQLIYGNPIPGYDAPAQVTVPLAARPLHDLGRLFAAAHKAGALRVPAGYAEVPATVTERAVALNREYAIDAPAAATCLLVSGWARIHGMVMLELFGHLEPVVGDAAAYFAYEVDAWLTQLGLSP